MPKVADKNFKENKKKEKKWVHFYDLGEDGDCETNGTSWVHTKRDEEEANILCEWWYKKI